MKKIVSYTTDSQGKGIGLTISEMEKAFKGQKPDHVFISKKQADALKKLFGYSKKGQIVAKGYHTWVTDGKGGFKIDD